VELEHHHQVGERREPGHRVGPEPRRIEPDERLDPAPVVVDGLGAAADNDTHRLQRDHDPQS
jgi:hypothetical protein